MKKLEPNSDYSWINTLPAEEEINIRDGAEFLPIPIVEKKLFKLDPLWGTENFKFRIFLGKSGLMFLDGSLEVVVTYGGRARKLVGAATLMIPASTEFDHPDANNNFSATIKSECIKNAVKPIGVAFGQGLNDRLTAKSAGEITKSTGRKKPAPVDMPVDAKMQASYNNAVETANQNAMDTLRLTYPKIQYTGTKKLNHA